MKNRHIFAIIVFTFLFLPCLKAQDMLPEEKAFIRSLLEAESGGDSTEVSELNVDQEPYSVSLGDEMDRYSVSFHIIAHEDLNDDGIADYIIYRNSEGMLGGNANTNNQYIFYIMKDDREIDKSYEILGYAPFSYNIIENASYYNKRWSVDIRQNFRTYHNGGEELPTAHLSFVYKDDNLYEESYLTGCAMAEMKDKRIFKSELEGVERELNIDMHNYTETSLEKYVSENMTLSAWLGGCDNLTLGFSSAVKLSPGVKPSSLLYKKTVLDVMQFLSDNTRYKTVLNKVISEYGDISFDDDEVKDINFDGTWKCNIPRYDYDKDSHSFKLFVYIENIVNSNQTDNWDITVRSKK